MYLIKFENSAEPEEFKTHAEALWFLMNKKKSNISKSWKEAQDLGWSIEEYSEEQPPKCKNCSSGDTYWADSAYDCWGCRKCLRVSAYDIG